MLRSETHILTKQQLQNDQGKMCDLTTFFCSQICHSSIKAIGKKLEARAKSGTFILRTLL